MSYLLEEPDKLRKDKADLVQKPGTWLTTTRCCPRSEGASFVLSRMLYYACVGDSGLGAEAFEKGSEGLACRKNKAQSAGSHGPRAHFGMVLKLKVRARTGQAPTLA